MTTDLTIAREHLASALEAELIGPYDGADAADTSTELLRIPPSRWYLTGFLAPMEARALREQEPDGDDEFSAGSDTGHQDTTEEPGPKRRHFLPASVGLSLLLPPVGEGAAGSVRVSVRWADYVALRGAEAEAALEESGSEWDPGAQSDGKGADDTSKLVLWRRVPRGPEVVEVPLDSGSRSEARGRISIALPGEPEVTLEGKLATAAQAPGLPPGTRALSLFVVNRRQDRPHPEERYLFQVGFEVEAPGGIQPRRDRRGEGSVDRDDCIADLQFRDRAEWASGHGVSVQAAAPEADGIVRNVAIRWIPRAEVTPVAARNVPGLTVSMETLAKPQDAEAIRDGLRGLPEAYGSWIEDERLREVESDERLREVESTDRADTQRALLHDAERAKRRIEEGIALLATDETVRDAFLGMNWAMAKASRITRPDEEPCWRLFQLAFVLLSLPSLADEDHPDRDTVELIYFPTGGGKTEAYLGVIGVTLLLRRLRGASRADGGYGVAVILRYTLRLLTLDQLGRALRLVCGLEMLRRKRPAKLGEERFTIGLWVGKTATANTLQEVRKAIDEAKSDPSPEAASPLPLSACPWCHEEIRPRQLSLVPNPRQPEGVRVACFNRSCEFHLDHSPEGLPILFVDEQIYRELPSILLATVDKFAMLPWRGETGMLFGRAQGRRGKQFFGPLDGAVPRDAVHLPDGLRPPELIVQDELHLISGPLGTMVGLYETAIQALCGRPKILAATATIRQAHSQIRALFGRTSPAIFPPPGMDDGESFFSQLDPGTPSRLYLGLAAPGRSMKALLLRTYVALLSAAGKVWRERRASGLEDTNADGYMTLAGYFNSLRELGGMRRLVEDEVVRRCGVQTERRPLGADADRWFADRTLQQEPVELTSRESTSGIKHAKADLDKRHDDPDHVDVLLASNMISVGLDIGRLGLMVVAGQPKTTAEYIQASSRVGREPKVAPGLVVTCFNIHRPRDRSHYEHFTAYHESFYRNVEASSVTPFSAPALARGLAGTLVALTRLLETDLTPPAAASEIEEHIRVGKRAVEVLAARARRHRRLDEAALDRLGSDVTALSRSLLDTWRNLAAASRADAGQRVYSRFDRVAKGRPLLFTTLDADRPPPTDKASRFEAPTSLRDVEPGVDLWLQRQHLGSGP